MPELRFPRRDEIPESARVDGSKWSRLWLCNGDVRTWNGPTIQVESPLCSPNAAGKPVRPVLGELPSLDSASALAALEAAARAWDGGRGEWPAARVAKRIEASEAFLKKMIAVREDVVRLLMWEIAKTRKDCETEFDRTVEYCRDTIEALKLQDRESSRFALEHGFLAQIRRSPLGVVLSMGPFNYPLNETFTTLFPALIAGNTIVAKLPKYGGLCQIPLLEAFATCFPRGVVNVLQGDGATIVGPIMESGTVDCLAFIGSARVCNVLKKQHPRPNHMRAITGLGAKNPAFILPDADLDLAAKECIAGALTFNGQRCTALKMIQVHESVADAFSEKIRAGVAALRAGMPWEAGVTITPLPEHGKPQALKTLADQAISKGARVLNEGGGNIAGTFYAPAVIRGASPATDISRVEQFGPIVPIATFRENSELLDWVAQSPYGQQCSIFGRDAASIAPLIDALANQISRINLNTQCRRGPDTFPFTGRKDSAEGTLSVADALRAFSIRAIVCTSTDPANKQLVTEIVTRRLSHFLSTDFLF